MLVDPPPSSWCQTMVANQNCITLSLRGGLLGHSTSREAKLHVLTGKLTGGVSKGGRENVKRVY